MTVWDIVHGVDAVLHDEDLERIEIIGVLMNVGRSLKGWTSTAEANRAPD
jgi:hypothetical protein